MNKDANHEGKCDTVTEAKEKEIVYRRTGKNSPRRRSFGPQTKVLLLDREEEPEEDESAVIAATRNESTSHDKSLQSDDKITDHSSVLSSPQPSPSKDHISVSEGQETQAAAFPGEVSVAAFLPPLAQDSLKTRLVSTNKSPIPTVDTTISDPLPVVEDNQEPE